MSTPVFAYPSNTRFSDVCRHLPVELTHAIDRDRAPHDGDLVLVTPPAGASGLSVQLVSGRIATAYPGDPVLAVAARYRTPLGASCDAPDALGLAQWVNASGIIGRACNIGGVRSVPPDVQILGVAVDRDGEAIQLGRLVVPAAPTARPPLSLAVISAATGARASQVTEALVLGLSRMGQVTGAAKPFGMVDSRARWRLLDHGAVLALDPVDSGRLDGSDLDGAALQALVQGQLSLIAAAGGQASVVRLGGGLASPAMARLLNATSLPEMFDGVVVAATDALSATETAVRLGQRGLRVLAISGALTRSPLASREAQAALAIPVLGTEMLVQPAMLQRLMSHALRPFQPNTAISSLAA